VISAGLTATSRQVLHELSQVETEKAVRVLHWRLALVGTGQLVPSAHPKERRLKRDAIAAVLNFSLF
jgi:hypothetical protein